MHIGNLTESGKVELVQSLNEVSELLCELAGSLKVLAHSGVVLTCDASFAEEISKEFDELSKAVLSWVSRKQGDQGIGER